MSDLECGKVVSEEPWVKVRETAGKFVEIRSGRISAVVHNVMGMNGYTFVATNAQFSDGTFDSTWVKDPTHG